MLVAEFRHSSNFTGFIYQIQGNIDSFITIKSGSVYENKTVHNPRNAFNYSHYGEPAATGTTDKWISFSLLNNNFFYVTHYELQQRTDAERHFMEEWSFEAYDGNNWTKLDTSWNDDSFNKTGAQKIMPCTRGIYQQFRIREEGQNILVLNRIDIYGIFCQNKEICISYLRLKFTNRQSRINHIPLCSIFLIIKS